MNTSRFVDSVNFGWKRIRIATQYMKRRRIDTVGRKSLSSSFDGKPVDPLWCVDTTIYLASRWWCINVLFFLHIRVTARSYLGHVNRSSAVPKFKGNCRFHFFFISHRGEEKKSRGLAYRVISYQNDRAKWGESLTIMRRPEERANGPTPTQKQTKKKKRGTVLYIKEPIKFSKFFSKLVTFRRLRMP